MQFNSFIFILLFLPLTVLLYYISNRISRHVGKLVIVVSSITFYCYTNLSISCVLGISILINYLFSFAINKIKRKGAILFLIPVSVNVILLLFYKYLNFLISNINFIWSKHIALVDLVLPVGISFFTFQQIAYLLATYKGEIEKPNFIDYISYILYFPKILMGPLMDPVDFMDQINDISLKKVNWDNIASGLKIFSFGLFKKVMIADTFAKAVEWGYSNIDGTTSMDWILIMLFYTFEIYFDFSGYSDMAVGSSLLLNITLPINFDSPYKAISIRDFWKRWHISLTSFFTKYVYIPLGGNRKGLVFTCLNTFVVFLVSGIWHGANWTFILWGTLHGILCILERLFVRKQSRISEPVKWFCTFLMINILWLLFRSESIQQWWTILTKVVCLQDLNVSDGIINSFNLQESAFISDVLGLKWSIENIRGFWMNIYLLSSYGICLLFENNYKSLNRRSWFLMIVSAIAFIWGFICLGEESVFVYFNF